MEVFEVRCWSTGGCSSPCNYTVATAVATAVARIEPCSKVFQQENMRLIHIRRISEIHWQQPHNESDSGDSTYEGRSCIDYEEGMFSMFLMDSLLDVSLFRTIRVVDTDGAPCLLDDRLQPHHAIGLVICHLSDGVSSSHLAITSHQVTQLL